MTFSELPNSPLYFALNVVAPALIAVESSVRVTYSVLLYDKKLAAEKNDCWLLHVPSALMYGLPNLAASCDYELISTLSFVGPQRKVPTKAPSLVPTAGTAFVKSISLTFMPGLS